MADIILAKPEAGTRSVVQSVENARIQLNFMTGDALLERSGDDLVFSFEDGSSIVIQDFYTAYTRESVPDFILDGAQIAGADFFAALNLDELMPAAGPAASTAEGGRFHEYANTELIDGLDRLDGLDLSSSRAFSPEREAWGGLRGNDVPNFEPALNEPGSLAVEEAGVFHGGNEENPGIPSISGTLTGDDPNNDNITFHLVDGSGASVSSIPTKYGVMALNPDGTYTYTLNNDSTDTQSLACGTSVTETFTVRVEDEHGAWTDTNITVTIRGTNDRPELELEGKEASFTEDAGAYESGGKFTVTDVDADAGTNQTFLIAADDGELTQTGHKTAEGSTPAVFETEYGTLTVDPDGTWTYKLDNDSEAVQGLGKDETHIEEFTITVVDEHGASSEQTITVTITGVNGLPVPDPAGGSLTVRETGVWGDADRGGHPDPNETLDGSSKVSGQIQVKDEDRGETHTFYSDALKGKGEAGSTFTLEGTLERNGEPSETQSILCTVVETETITLPDGSTASFVTSFKTDYGTFTLNPETGVYSFEPQQDSEAMNALEQGDRLSFNIGVTVQDSAGGLSENPFNLAITIEGTNDRPTLSITETLDVVESGVGKDAAGNPYENGTDKEENTPFTGKDTSSGEAEGSDVDRGDEDGLVYGAVAGKDAGTLSDDARFAEDAEGNPSGEVRIEGEYGTLILSADGSYRYVLAEKGNEGIEDDDSRAGKVNALNENDERTDSFVIYVKDEHGSWDSKTLTVNITGTNDRPELFLREDRAYWDEAGKEVGSDTPDTSLHEASRDGREGGEAGVVSLTGSVYATDADEENGGGQETTTDDNHGLEFSLTGGKSSLEDESGAKVDVDINVDGGKAISTDYGTLTIDEYGNYCYDLNMDSEKLKALSEGDTVTETFTVRVTDDRGAWDEKEITVTIKGTNDLPILVDGSSEMNVVEAGVWGSKDPAHKPDEKVSSEEEYTQSVQFDKVDANDTHSLVIGGDHLPKDAGLMVSGPVSGDFADALTGSTYSITETGSAGEYTVTATIPGINGGNPITLGTLTLEQNGEDGDLSYTFTPNQGEDGLQNIPQGMDLSIQIPLKVKDNHGVLSEGTHTATINIEGTNDRPSISVKEQADDDIYVSGVGRDEDNGDKPITTEPDTLLNPAENQDYSSKMEITGSLTASDPDAGDETSFFISGAKGNNGNGISCAVGDDESTVTVSLNGEEIGKLILDPETGSYSFKLTNEAPLKGYEEGSSFSFTVDFKSKDQHGSTSTNSVQQEFTIHASNDKPTITNGEENPLDKSILESEDKVTGRVEFEDADKDSTDADGKGDSHTFGLITKEDYENLQDGESVDMKPSISADGWGKLEINPETGEYTFYLDKTSNKVIGLREGQDQELHFYVVVRDDKGAYDVQEITITITGEDTPTVFRGNAAIHVVEEAGVIAPEKDGKQNTDKPGKPTASGKLEAEEFDKVGEDFEGADPDESLPIEYSVTGEGVVQKTFGDLDDPTNIQEAINKAFSGEEWGSDATVSIVTGIYGTLYLNSATGQYFYQLNNGSEATDALKQGQIEYDEFTIHAGEKGNPESLGADQPLKIAVVGTNDAPVVRDIKLSEGTPDGITLTPDEDNKGYTISGLEEDGEIQSVSGTISASDVDSPADSLQYLIRVTDTDKDGNVSYSYVGSDASNKYGYLTLDEKTGVYRFVVNNDAVQELDKGDSVDVSFTVVVRDEYHAVSEEKELTFTITGKEDTASINKGSVTTYEHAAGAVEGSDKLVISDVDAGVKEFTSITFGNNELPLTGNGPWKIEGEYGTLTLTKGDDGSLSYTYTLSNKGKEALRDRNETDSVEETFTVSGTSNDESVSSEIVVTIKGENDAPYELTLEGKGGAEVTGEGTTWHMSVGGWDPVRGKASGSDYDNDANDLRYYVDDADGTTEAQVGLQTIKGQYGYLVINSETGEYSYTVDPALDAYQQLAGTDGGQDSFTIIVSDPYGATHEETIVFDVTHKEGGNGQGDLTLKEPNAPVEVTEDNREYFKKDENGNDAVDETGKPIDNTPPPAVESKFFKLRDEDGNTVKLEPDDIWLVDNGGTREPQPGDGKTHIVNTDYGALVLEKNKAGEWGYRFVLNNGSDAVQSLDEGDTETLTFYVQTGSQDPVKITVVVSGINDRPVIEGAENLRLEDTATDAVEGTLTTSDPDASDVGNAEGGTGNLQYTVSAAEDSGLVLKPEGDGSYTVNKDGVDWGTFTLKQDGTYSFKASKQAAEKLLAGENEELKLTITVDDGSKKDDGSPLENATASTDISITITGTNEEPKIEKFENLTVKEDTIFSDIGMLKVKDDRVDEGGNPTGLTYTVTAGAHEDNEGAETAGGIAAGKYGSLYVTADGSYTYKLNNQLQAVQELGEDDEPLTEIFTIYVKDKDGGVTSQKITVTINGTNDLPVLELDKPVLDIKEGDEDVSGKATASDVDKNDQDDLRYSFDGGKTEETVDGVVWSVVETAYGTFKINTKTGDYTFTLNNEADAVKNLRPTDIVKDSVTVVVTDGKGSVEKELAVHIKGTDSTPEVTDEGSLSVSVDDTAERVVGQIKAEGWDKGIDGNGSDPLTYTAEGSQPVTEDGKVWQRIEGKHGTLFLDSSTGAYRYEPSEEMKALAQGEHEEDSFKVVISDSTGNKIEADISVTIDGTNDGPVINSNTITNADGTSTGRLEFSDVDTSDTHTMTFDDLYADDKKTPLSVDTANMPEGSVSVYNAEGVLVGTLALQFTKGEGDKDVLSYTFTPDADYVNSLPVGSSNISFGVTVTDRNVAGTDMKSDTKPDQTFTIENKNDVPESGEGTDVSRGDYEGTIVFSDKDILDTHTVTFNGLKDAQGNDLAVALSDGTSQKFEVYKDGVSVGTLEVSYTPGDKNQGNRIEYEFTPASDLNGLPVGDTSLEFTVTVSDSNQGTLVAGEGGFTVSNANDAPQIVGDVVDDVTGTLTFSDADKADTHTVTFDGLYAEGGETPLSVDTAKVPGKPVSVYNAKGVLVGTLALQFTKGDGDEDVLSYTFTPDADYANSLPKGGSEEITFSVSVADNNGSSLTDSGETQHSFVVANENDASDVAAAVGADKTSGAVSFSDAGVQDSVVLSLEYGGKPYAVAGNACENPGVGTITLQETGTNAYGYLFVPDANLTDSVPDGKRGTLDIAFKVEDRAGESGTAAVRLGFKGTNNTPEADVDPAIRHDAQTHTMSGSFTVTAPDGHPVEVPESAAGTYGSVAITEKQDGTWGYTYTLEKDPGEDTADSFTITFKDQYGAENAFTINVPLSHLGNLPLDGAAFAQPAMQNLMYDGIPSIVASLPEDGDGVSGSGTNGFVLAGQEMPLPAPASEEGDAHEPSSLPDGGEDALYKLFMEWDELGSAAEEIWAEDKSLAASAAENDSLVSRNAAETRWEREPEMEYSDSAFFLGDGGDVGIFGVEALDVFLSDAAGNGGHYGGQAGGLNLEDVLEEPDGTLDSLLAEDADGTTPNSGQDDFDPSLTEIKMDKALEGTQNGMPGVPDVDELTSEVAGIVGFSESLPADDVSLVQQLAEASAANNHGM